MAKQWRRKLETLPASFQMAGVAWSFQVPLAYAVLFAFIAYAHDWAGRLTSVFVIAALTTACVWKWRGVHRRQRQLHSLSLAQVDKMSGHDFERFVGALLTTRGHKAEVTRGSRDNGVDVVAHMDGERWAIQCKRQASKVSREAISDAVAATSSTLFKCTRAMVITNHYFSPAAIQYAQLRRDNHFVRSNDIHDGRW